MLYRTHAAGGFIAGYLLTGSLSCGAVAAAAALLPDVESPKSFVGQKLPGVSHAGELVFGHRQAFHSLPAAVGFLIVAFVFSKSVHLPSYFAFAGFAGYLSHLLLDTFNPAGVPWLWPFKLRFRIPLTQSGGPLEKVLVLPALTLACLFFAGRDVVSTVLQ